MGFVQGSEERRDESSESHRHSVPQEDARPSLPALANSLAGVLEGWLSRTDLRDNSILQPSQILNLGLDHVSWL